MSAPPTASRLASIRCAWTAWLRGCVLLAVLVTVVVAASAAAAATPARVTITVRTNDTGARLGDGFVGFGVVAKTLARGQFARTDLPAYMRLLDRDGTLRIGGNRVYSFWTSTGRPAPRWSKGEVTPGDLKELAKSVAGTGWRVILGVPILHTGPTRVANEARFAKRILGPELLGIEVGNEPNLFGISESSYFARFQREVRAIRTAVPGVSIVGPAMGRTGFRWLRQFTHQEAAHPDISLLTTHEYPLSICGHRHPTIAQLLSTGSQRHEAFAADSAVAAARMLGVPAAIDETNSVICWGAPGVSNTFASALWILDYGLLIAQHGVASANFQTRISGCTPYLPLCTAPRSKRLYARPEFYGLLALRQMGSGLFVKTADSDSAKLRAFTIRNGSGRLSVALDNLGPAVTAVVRVPGAHLADGRETVLRTGSSRGLAATGEVTLGGRRVRGNAHFSAPRYTPVAVAGSTATLRLAAHTAAIVKFG